MIIALTSPACSAVSSTAAPAELDRAIAGLDRAIACPAPPAALTLCLDGSAPAPFDAARPSAPRCPSPVRLRGDERITQSGMARIASDAIAWALREQALRLSLADWKACGGRAE